MSNIMYACYDHILRSIIIGKKSESSCTYMIANGKHSANESTSGLRLT